MLLARPPGQVLAVLSELNGRVNMWIIQHPDKSCEQRGAFPTMDMVPILSAQFPDAVIYRSKTVCHNEFGAAAYVKEWVQDGEREVITTDAEGNEVKTIEPIMVLNRVENPYTIEDGRLVVRDMMGAELISFPMEVVYDASRTAENA